MLRIATDVNGVVEGLEDDGYAVVEGVLDRAETATIAGEMRRVLASVPFGRNDFEGFGTKRVYALFGKTRAWDAPATSTLVLGVLDRVLGASYQLSAPTGIEIGPGERAQVLHRDDSIYPIPEPHPEVVVNTMWALDDFTEENGATRLVPGSHRRTGPPAPGTPTIAATMTAGSVMFYVGSVWHGGGANRTDRPRLGVILEYVAGWLRPQENHLLAVPRDVAADLPDRLLELLGYNIYPPFVGYVDGRHPIRALREAVRGRS
ncbi:MAG TPA: phytanoyl-CoA dioxygenase family protein [Acidimicrobiales bacterium]|nr:phytanoyl-CoA dioxygenase family protein [Acidimicrobiales bacterium]